MSKAEKDQLVRFLFEDAGVRGELVRLDASYKSLLENHAYPDTIAGQLGEALATVALLAATVKLDGSLILQVQGSGPMSLLVAQASSEKTIRGMARFEAANHEEMTFSQLAGEGRIVMTIDAEGSERYQGIVDIHGDSLAEALQDYFSRSEQLPTRLWLACRNGVAAGMLIQQLPSEHGDELDWERLLLLASTLSDDELLDLPFETILHRLFHEERVKLFEAESIAFRCSCSRDKIESALLGMGQDEVQGILQDEGIISATCDFCLATYQFDAVDVAALFKGALPASKGQ